MRHVVALVFVLLVAATGLQAATFEPVTDAQLVARAELIVTGRVLDAASRVRPDGVIVTDYHLAVDDVLKGSASGTITISELGGRGNGIFMIVPGSAVYVPGSRVVAFLKPGLGGTWYTSHMALGQFQFERRDGVDVLARHDTGIEIEDARAFAPRQADAFVKFVRDTVRGVPTELATAPVANNAAKDLQPVTNLAAADYVFVIGSPARPARWKDCDTGCLIGFFYNGDQPGVIDSGSNVGIDKAMDAWTDDANSFVHLGLGGSSTVDVSSVAVYDTENTIVLNAPNNPPVTGCDGSLGCGFIWINDGNPGDAGDPDTSSAHTFRGTRFYSVLNADVVIRGGSLSQGFFEGLVAHELGHALAFKHASVSGALMSPSIPSNVTASLKTYDRNAMAEVYGEGAPCDPPVITGTSGGGNLPYGENKQLSVTVTGTSPFTFQWYRGTSGDTSNPVGSNNDKYTTPAITTTSHFWVKVTSQCGSLVSVNSPTITLTPDPCNPPAIFAQPQSQRVLPGATVKLTVAANGTTPLTYRWYQAAVVGDESTPVGTNSNEFTTPALTQTTSYWVKITNACGTATSQLATITVGTQCVPATIATQPGDTTVQLGNGISLAVTAAGDTPFSYQWYEGEKDDVTKPIANATAATLVLPAFTTAGTFRYWVKVTNACGSASSNTIVITVPCGTTQTPVVDAPPASHVSAGYDIHWSGNLANASSFELQEALNSAFTSGLKTFTVTGALSHHIDPHTEITTDTRFYYRVRAFSACNQIPTSYSAIASTVVTKPLPDNSLEFSISVPEGANQPFTQNYLVPGFGETASNGDTFSITTDASWLTVFPSSGALSAGGTTVQLTVNPGPLEVGTTTATILVQRTSGASSKGGPVTNGTTTTSSLPFSLSKVTPVSPLPRGNEPPPGTLIIPAIAHADGIGARFQSDVRIANTSSQEMTYEISFTPSQTDGTTTGKKSLLTVPANDTKGLDDIVKAWYGAGVLGEGGLGTLEIRPLGDNIDPLKTFASSRTYAVTATGTLGQFIPALALEKFVGAVADNPLNKISLQQVANSTAYRTNLGFVEGSGSPVTLSVRLLDGQNNVLQTVTRSLPAYGHEQVSFASLFGNIPLNDGRVEVQVTSSTGKATAYASVVDNKTTDPLLVFPVQAEKVSATSYVVPGVAELDNGVSSNFHTDMRIFNASTTPVTVSVQYFPQAGDATPRPAPVNLTIGANEVRAVDSVLPTLFGLTRTGGAVTVDAPGNVPLVLTARTFSRDSSGGTYGQFIPGVTATDAVGLGERGLELLQLEQSPQYRTNLGLVEVTGKPVTIEILATAPQSKTSAVVQMELQGHEFRQPRIFTQMGFTNAVYNGRITVRVIGGEGRVAAYGSVVDNRTVDPTYVPAQ